MISLDASVLRAATKGRNELRGGVAVTSGITQKVLSGAWTPVNGATRAEDTA